MRNLMMAGWLALTLGAAEAQTSRYFSTLAGSAGSVVSSVDATGIDAQFNGPRAVAADGLGNLYVADAGNHSIRKITAAGVVTTLAGVAGSQGYTDGAGTAAKFGEPFGIAADTSGNVYVADTLNNTIRKITPAGVVSTLAGNGKQGSSDGTGTAAQFNEPRGVAVDSAGNVYVADYQNSLIRKITAAGVVTTLAGAARQEGSTDGTGTAARFKAPNGIAVDSSGNVYVTDSGNRTVRKITSAGVVTTFAGSATGAGSATDGTGTAARFGDPRQLSVDSAGNLYVADYTAHTIRKITPAGVVTTVAGTSGSTGSTDGTGTAALFYYPSGTAVDSSGNVYVADTSNHAIRKISAAGAVSLFAGKPGRTSSVDGTSSNARFQDPYAVAVDGAGNVYVADATDHSVRKITAAGVTTTLAGLPGTYGYSDGSGTAALFRTPYGITAANDGTVYLADTGNKAIRKITSAGVVTTVSLTDSSGKVTGLNAPYGVAVGTDGTLYVVDGNTIKKISTSGVLTTLAGSGGNGLVNGTGTAAQFSVPFDITVDSTGNLYVCDHGNHAIRKITPAGVVTTLAGSGSAGFTNATGSAATFTFPSGIAVDSNGNVYVADTDNQVIRQITPAGVVTTVAGNGVGSTNAIGTKARFFNPKDVAVDSNGNLYVTDRGNHTIRKGSPLSTTVSADCLFDWAEANYATLFKTASTSQTASPYYYRYFSATQAYLGISTSDGKVYYLGSSGGVLDVGSQSTWFAQAGCQ